MTYEFVAAAEGNFKRGRRKNTMISAIVIHYTASMSLDGTIGWFKNPNAKVSAHYVIGRDGRVVQMVRDEDTAYHAGVSELNGTQGVNLFSIGIELVGTADSGFTDRQLASFYTLVEELVMKYKIRPGRVVGHSHISPGRKIDPDGYNNQFNWNKLRQVSETAYRLIQT